MARFMRRGVTRVYHCTAAALTSTSAPTAAMLVAAGTTRLDTDIAEMNGFTFSAEPIEVPDMATTFTQTIPGGDSVENSNIVFYQDNASTTISTALAKSNVTSYIVIFPKGVAGTNPVATEVCDIWPVTIGSNAKQYTAANEAAKFNVVFNPSAVPVIDKALA